MPRTVQDAKLDSRAARLRLKVRREPYFRSISEGLAIGYRKGSKGGTWIARHYTQEHGRRFYSIGTADDVVDPDGIHVFSFAHAQEQAREWFVKLAREDAGEINNDGYLICDAMADYLKDYIRRGGKAPYMIENAINTHINPILGSTLLAKLKRTQLENWLDAIATSKPRARTKAGGEQNYHKIVPGAEGLRRRRSTANRIFTVLKAALNLAHHNKRVLTRDAWETVKPYRDVDAAKIRYLQDNEAVRLVNACPDDLRRLVKAALFTGARYSELTSLTAHDFNPDTGTIYIARSKSGKPRHIALTEEGALYFREATAGLASDAIMFLRASGAKWKHADQSRPMKEACKIAKITPAISFHVLRHTYGSRLAMRGVSLAVIAAQLGHLSTRITEKHYAHLAPSYVADTLLAAMPHASDIEKRDRAVVAFLALAGVRDAALISLKVGDVDRERQEVWQDPKHVKTKNRKGKGAA